MHSCILIPSSIFNSIFNYQPGSNVQLVIQQYIELPATGQVANVKLVSQQYIELPAGYLKLAVHAYSAVYSITSQVRMYSW